MMFAKWTILGSVVAAVLILASCSSTPRVQRVAANTQIDLSAAGMTWTLSRWLRR